MTFTSNKFTINISGRSFLSPNGAARTSQRSAIGVVAQIHIGNNTPNKTTSGGSSSSSSSSNRSEDETIKDSLESADGSSQPSDSVAVDQQSLFNEKVKRLIATDKTSNDLKKKSGDLKSLQKEFSQLEKDVKSYLTKVQTSKVRSSTDLKTEGELQAKVDELKQKALDLGVDLGDTFQTSVASDAAKAVESVQDSSTSGDVSQYDTVADNSTAIDRLGKAGTLTQGAIASRGKEIERNAAKENINPTDQAQPTNNSGFPNSQSATQFAIQNFVPDLYKQAGQVGAANGGPHNFLAANKASLQNIQLLLSGGGSRRKA